MSTQSQYYQQIYQQWKSKNGLNEQQEPEYECEKIIHHEQIKLPFENRFLTLIRYYTLGALVFKNGMKEQSVGSGVLTSKNIILTAAHNLFDKYYNKKNTGHIFYLAGNGISKTYYQVQSFRYPPQYEKSNEIKYDYGIIKLKKSVNHNEFLKLSVPCQKCIKKADKKISIYGYPKFNDNYYCKDGSDTNIKLYQYGLQKKNVIIQASADQGKICYAMSTYYGHSGSPVVCDKKIIAVHVANAKSNKNFNVGRMITPDMMANLKKWYTQLGIADSFRNHEQECIHFSKAPTEKLKTEMIKQQKKSTNKILYVPTRLNTLSNFNPKPLLVRKPIHLNQSINLKNQTQPSKNPEVNGLSLSKNKFQLNLSQANLNKFSLHKANQINSSRNANNLSSKVLLTNFLNTNIQKIQSLLLEGIRKYESLRYDQALSKFNQCLSLQEKEKGKECIESAVIYMWIGKVYNKKNVDNQARQYYEKSISIHQKYNKVNENYAEAFRDMGKLYLKQKMYEIAKQYYQQAITVFQKIGAKAEINQVSQEIIECLQNQKRIKRQNGSLGSTNKLKQSMQIKSNKKSYYD